MKFTASEEYNAGSKNFTPTATHPIFSIEEILHGSYYKPPADALRTIRTELMPNMPKELFMM